eukprot:8672768-Alexandrium_andersonii.AAC.1
MLKSRQAFESGTARTQKRPQCQFPKLWMGWILCRCSRRRRTCRRNGPKGAPEALVGAVRGAGRSPPPGKTY